MKFPAASGIAIAPILFVIALLAILATAISAATGSWSSDTAQESDSALAEAIISQGEVFAVAVQRVMMAHGCSAQQVNFSNHDEGTLYGWNIYGNGNAPSDKRCNIFDLNGGGAISSIPPKGTNARPSGIITVPNNWRFSTHDTMVAANSPAITASVIIDSLSLCIKLNMLVIKSQSVQQFGLHIEYFADGSFASNPSQSFTSLQGCIQTTNWWSVPPAGTYVYYQILLRN